MLSRLGNKKDIDWWRQDHITTVDILAILDGPYGQLELNLYYQTIYVLAYGPLPATCFSKTESQAKNTI